MHGSLIQHVAWSAATFLLVSVAALLVFAAFEHAFRRKSLRALDRLGGTIGPLLERLYSGLVTYEEGLDLIRQLPAAPGGRALEALLMDDRNPPDEHIPLLQRLCQDLGLTELWESQLRIPDRGQDSNRREHARFRHPFSFVLRAEAAENLGIIRRRESWPLLALALLDPHVTVRSVAARALARIGEPESFSRLAEQIPSAALQAIPGISAATLKVALAAFPLAEARRLAVFLEDPSWQVRSLAAGVVVAMLQREHGGGIVPHCHGSLHPGVVNVFLERLAVDDAAELRARAADLAGYVDDPRSLPRLLQLAKDSEWFVRLRAVKALELQPGTPIEVLRACLTDANWHVREAAAQALSSRGQPGVCAMLDHFSGTNDRYSQEQIAEQMARSGLLSSLLERVRRGGRVRDRVWIEGMARPGEAAAVEVAAATIEVPAPRRESVSPALVAGGSLQTSH